MSNRLAELLRQQLSTHKSDWVFPAIGEDAIQRRRGHSRAESACTRAVVKDLTWHDLRQTFSSRLAMAGASLATIHLAGTITITQRYAHLSPEHNRAAMELLSRGPKPAPELPLPWGGPEAVAGVLVDRLSETDLAAQVSAPGHRGRHLRVVR